MRKKKVVYVSPSTPDERKAFLQAVCGNLRGFSSDGDGSLEYHEHGLSVRVGVTFRRLSRGGVVDVWVRDATYETPLGKALDTVEYPRRPKRNRYRERLDHCGAVAHASPTHVAEAVLASMTKPHVARFLSGMLERARDMNAARMEYEQLSGFLETFTVLDRDAAHKLLTTREKVRVDSTGIGSVAVRRTYDDCFEVMIVVPHEKRELLPEFIAKVCAITPEEQDT